VVGGTFGEDSRKACKRIEHENLATVVSKTSSEANLPTNQRQVFI
jgi:hypothetical protein